jgi:hypothetical protein
LISKPGLSSDYYSPQARSFILCSSAFLFSLVIFTQNYRGQCLEMLRDRRHLHGSHVCSYKVTNVSNNVKHKHILWEQTECMFRLTNKDHYQLYTKMKMTYSSQKVVLYRYVRINSHLYSFCQMGNLYKFILVLCLSKIYLSQISHCVSFTSLHHMPDFIATKERH